ncbi:hypothetical protein ACQY0O_003913 [Thecaphora frezii]
MRCRVRLLLTLTLSRCRSLTNVQTQREFRAYISQQVAQRFAASRAVQLPSLSSLSYLPPDATAGSSSSADSNAGKAPTPQQAPMDAKRDGVEQVMLMVRKLREGCVAAGALDAFTVDVYELSVYLALLCLNVPQLASSLPRLVLDLYAAVPISDCLAAPTALDDIARIGIPHDASDRDPIPPLASGTPSALSAVRVLERRAHLASLLLLRTLCLSTHASRLGQYATPAANATAPPSVALASTLKEYPALSATVRSSLQSQAASIDVLGLSASAEAALEVADQVYRGLRDSNVFIVHRLLSERGRLTVWQRILVLQVVPTLREAAWRTIRRAYLHVPVADGVAAQIDAGKVAQRQRQKSVAGASASVAGGAGGDGAAGDWIVRVLLLGEDVLPPPPPGADATTTGVKVRPTSATGSKAIVPDAWDDDNDDNDDDGKEGNPVAGLTEQLAETSLATSPTEEEGRRLVRFMSCAASAATFAATELPNRLVEARDGGWIFKVK